MPPNTWERMSVENASNTWGFVWFWFGFWEAGRQTEVQRDFSSTSSFLTHHEWSLAGAKAGSQDPVQVGSPQGKQGFNYLSHGYCLPGCALAGARVRSWSQELNLHTRIWEMGILTARLSARCWDRHLAQWLRCSLAYHIHIWVCALSPGYSAFQLPANVHPGRQWWQVLESLTPTWGTWNEFQAPVFGFTQSCCCGHSGSESVDERYLSISLSVSVFQIKRK